MSYLPNNSYTLLSIRDAADRLGVSTKTLRRWEEQGQVIPQRTFGNQRRYTIEQIEQLKNHASPAGSSYKVYKSYNSYKNYIPLFTAVTVALFTIGVVAGIMHGKKILSISTPSEGGFIFSVNVPAATPVE